PEPSATGETCLPARLLSILAALPSDGTVERTALASAAGLSKHGIVPYLRHLRHTGAIAVDGNGYVLLPAGRAMIPQLYECVRERRLLHALRLFNADVRSGMRRTVRLRDRYAVLAAGRCECCGRTVADHGIVLHVDHIVPVARGGSNERSNLQALCDTCNAGKSDSLAA
ncbi:MAG: HNH endonuclease, partial [Pseudomonadota bacterium]